MAKITGVVVKEDFEEKNIDDKYKIMASDFNEVVSVVNTNDNILDNKTDKGTYTGTTGDLKYELDTAVFGGGKTYQTKALQDADIPISPENTPSKIANDPNPLLNGNWSVSGGIWVQNDSVVSQILDTEDIKTQGNGLLINDRAKDGTNSLGYYRIRSDFDWTADLSIYANSKIEIIHNFDISGGIITFPANVTIVNNGGSFNNYSEIVFNDTKIEAGLSFTFDSSGDVSGTIQNSFIYPDWFGGTNSSVEIQFALNFARDLNGGTVLLTSNLYDILTTVNIRNKTSLKGLGMNTTLRLANGVNKDVIRIYAVAGFFKIQDVEICNFKIDGNRDNQTTTDNVLGSGVYIKADIVNPSAPFDPEGTGELENIKMHHIISENCKSNGFLLSQNTFVTRGYMYTNLKASFNANGIYFDDKCEYTKVLESEFTNNENGVLDNGSSNNGIQNNIIKDNSDKGIHFLTSGRNTTKSIITGNSINHNLVGIQFEASIGTLGYPIDQVIIDQNQILANGTYGIRFNGVRNINVSNNIFSGNSENISNGYEDIFINSLCKNISVSRNLFRNSTGNTKYAVTYENPAPTVDLNDKSYHNIGDNKYIDWGTTYPINWVLLGAVNPLNANTNIIDGVFEYWNTAGLPPSLTAANTSGSVDINMIPMGTQCTNNADVTGNEIWVKAFTPRSSGASTPTFKRVL